MAAQADSFTHQIKVMKFNHKAHPPRLGFRPDDAAEMIGSPQLFTEMREAGWIKPVLQRHKLTLYSGDDIQRCWHRILAGENPIKG